MNLKTVKIVIFIFWIVVIAVLSVVPHANENGGLSIKLTESGMVGHFGAYFVGTALVFWVFRKNTLYFILISIFSILLYGVVLEIIQIYLPYRTFNPLDIAANGVGVGFFVIFWVVFWRRRPGMAS